MTQATETTLDELCVNTIRTLAMDAVEKANSGHPGTPMGLAPVTFVLYTRFMRHSPEHPNWPARDRFVLSAGHASMLLYSMLHLAGYGSRSRSSRTSASGLARRRTSRVRPHAGRRDHDRAARAGHVDTRSASRSASGCSPRASTRSSSPTSRFVIASDGDLEEGVSGEASSSPATSASPPDRLLRRQPHHDRGRDRARVLRGRRQALRGLRLVRAARRRPSSSTDGGGRRRRRSRTPAGRA